MTHEQFITLETAKLAKQAGFDWECSTFYTETFDYTNQEGTGKFEFLRDDNLRYRNPNDDRNSFVNHKGTLLEYKFEMLSAPTQSVLQRWLREVKGIHLNVLAWSNVPIEYSYITGRFYDGIKLSEAIGKEYIFPTYEAALEAGLQECLTLLVEKQC